MLTHMIRARLPTRASTRSFISAAALLVKVIARIEPGWALRSATSQAIRRVSTRVLPDPAPATTSSGCPAWTTASPLGLVQPVEQLLGRRAAPGGARLGRELLGVQLVVAEEPAGCGGGDVLISPPTLRVPCRRRPVHSGGHARPDRRATDPVADALRPMAGRPGLDRDDRDHAGRVGGASSSSRRGRGHQPPRGRSTARRSARPSRPGRRTSARWAHVAPRPGVASGCVDHGVTEDELSALHAPVGLDIGADEPGEIAVSILAEIIAERRGARLRRRLDQRPRRRDPPRPGAGDGVLPGRLTAQAWTVDQKTATTTLATVSRSRA